MNYLVTQTLRPRRIGFVSTRFQGTDGVSLEARKWVEVLESHGHICHFFAGASDRPTDRSTIVPEAHFVHPDIRILNHLIYSTRTRLPGVTAHIERLKGHLKGELATFVYDRGIELLVVENALALPMNLPLGLALAEYIAETGIPTIAHHHDMYWERQRYLVNCVSEYLTMAFPPNLPSIHHVVINSLAAQQLSLRTGIPAMIIPNVMDFENPPAPPDEYARDVRQALGVLPHERLFLQPTRVVQRKGIEHAIELTRRLGIDARLVISHASGDEQDDYEQHVREYASLLAVPVLFVSERIRHERGMTADGRKVYALQDVYLQADLVTYPSTSEGFGNAFLEALYYRRPIVVNNYSIFDVDIKPKGFRAIEFSGYVTAETIRQAQRVLQDPEWTREMVEQNFELGKRFYSYAVLERRLDALVAECFGELR